MPVINRIADFQDEIAGWRRDFHQNPELGYAEHRTAARVAELLRSFGVDEIVTGLGRTGVVGIIKGRLPGDKVVGLRADMDALPITERSGKPHASTRTGTMHACGHDGHTAMLLGAAKYLAETRNFAGAVAVIFQPAEEGGGGGRAMVQDGLMDRFGITEVFGMHNMPGKPVGTFAIRSGGLLASSDVFTIDIVGKGVHAAMPHKGIDPMLTAAHVTVALQSIVSRNIDPLAPAVISVTMIHGGDASNVIPNTVKITGTARSLSEAERGLIETRIGDVARNVAAAFGCTASYTYTRGYPVTVNAEVQTDFAAKVAAEIVGPDRVDANTAPIMGGEDFSFMLQARPGAFIFVGNGDTSQLHTDTYDFNDDAIPVGVSYWVRLAEAALPAT